MMKKNLYMMIQGSLFFLISIFLLSVREPLLSQNLKQVYRFPLSENKIKQMKLLHKERFMLLTLEWSKGANGERNSGSKFQIYDAEEKKLLEKEVDYSSLMKTAKNPEGLFGITAFYELIFFDGENGGFYIKQPGFDSRRQRPGLYPDKHPNARGYYAIYNFNKKSWVKVTPVSDFTDDYYESVLTAGKEYVYIASYRNKGIYPLQIDLTLTIVHGSKGTIEKRKIPVPPQKQKENNYNYVIAADERFFYALEYAEKGVGNQNPSMFLFDLKNEKGMTLSIPLTSYGILFTDDNHLIVGSNQLYQQWKYDLSTQKVVAKSQLIGQVQFFIPTLDRKGYLAFANTILASPKVIEVRDQKNLKVIKQIPVSSLFPGVKGIHPDGTLFTGSGRFLLTEEFAANGFPNGKALIIFEQTP